MVRDWRTAGFQIERRDIFPSEYAESGLFPEQKGRKMDIEAMAINQYDNPGDFQGEQLPERAPGAKVRRQDYR